MMILSLTIRYCKLLTQVFVLITTTLFCQGQNNDSLPINSIQLILNSFTAPTIDSSILVVINNTTVGTLREIKKPLTGLFYNRAIDSIQVIESTRDYNRRQEIDNKKVIRFFLKKEAFHDEIISHEIRASEKPSTVSESLKKHLERSVNPFIPSQNGAPFGKYTAIIQYKVDINGEISDIMPLTNEGYGMEEEIIKAILRYTKKEPKLLNGKPVLQFRKQPVTFLVTEATRFLSEAEPTDPPFKLSTYKIKAGEENLVEIEVNGVADKDIEVELSKGTIVRMSIGRYRARVNEKGKVTLSVWNFAKKKKQFIGSAEIEVE